MKKFVSLVALSCMLAIPASLTAAEASSEKQARTAIKFRQSMFQLIRSNMGDIGAMAKGQRPFDAAIMEKNGMRLEQLSLMIEDYMALDTRKYKADTEALDKIWVEKDAFAEKVSALTRAAQKLQLAARAGDESAFRPAIGAVGKTCKGCHDNFKAD